MREHLSFHYAPCPSYSHTPSQDDCDMRASIHSGSQRTFAAETGGMRMRGDRVRRFWRSEMSASEVPLRNGVNAALTIRLLYRSRFHHLIPRVGVADLTPLWTVTSILIKSSSASPQPESFSNPSMRPPSLSLRDDRTLPANWHGRGHPRSHKCALSISSKKQATAHASRLDRLHQPQQAPAFAVIQSTQPHYRSAQRSCQGSSEPCRRHREPAVLDRQHFSCSSEPKHAEGSEEV